MAITRTIKIDGRDVPFKASAAIPRLYRNRYRRDIFKDMNTLIKSVVVNDEGNSTLDTFTLEMFENIAHAMAKYADPTIPDTPEEWLDQFDTFSIYQIVPDLIELWNINIETDVEAKKNLDRLTAR